MKAVVVDEVHTSKVEDQRPVGVRQIGDVVVQPGSIARLDRPVYLHYEHAGLEMCAQRQAGMPRRHTPRARRRVYAEPVMAGLIGDKHEKSTSKSRVFTDN
ncbi:hypothetical protein [Mycobacterium sp.]|uniref:hypothetical protein n=1 Tax=Mycobacterium sp. TaxID=1785 RepID=UPI002636DF15|nr:hypothetical protein [Mycobacterium sp.]